jgi:hypothetical protein
MGCEICLVEIQIYEYLCMILRQLDFFKKESEIFKTTDPIKLYLFLQILNATAPSFLLQYPSLF